MLRKKPTRKDNRYEYKLTLGRDIHGKPLRKSFYSTVSLSDAKKKAEEYRVASEVSARTGEAFVTSTYKQPFVDVNTYELTYVSLVEGHLIPYFGGGAVERYSSGGHTGVLRHKDGMFGEPAEEMNCTPFVMSRGKPNKRYTPEFKKVVVETMMEERLSHSETCRRFEVNSRDQIKS